MFFSFITLTVGYALLLLMGYISFIPVHIVTVCVFGALVFSGQAIFYMIIIVNMTNTIEYNEHKTGFRHEAIVFSLRPFVAKFSSALQQGIFTGVLILSGVFILSQNVSTLEAQKNYFDVMTASEQVEYRADIEARQNILDDLEMDQAQKEEVYDALALVTFDYSATTDKHSMVINAAADSAFKEIATPSMRLSLRVAITIIPIILIYGSYLVLHKKFIIDEVYYEKINQEIIKKKQELSA